MYSLKCAQYGGFAHIVAIITIKAVTDEKNEKILLHKIKVKIAYVAVS